MTYYHQNPIPQCLKRMYITWPHHVQDVLYTFSLDHVSILRLLFEQSICKHAFFKVKVWNWNLIDRFCLFIETVWAKEENFLPAVYLLSNYLFTANVYDVTPTSGNICQFFKIQTNEVFSNLLFHNFKTNLSNIQNA